MRKHPNIIGETFLDFDKANNRIVGTKMIAENKYERVEKEVGKKDKQEVIEEVRAELAKVDVQ